VGQSGSCPDVFVWMDTDLPLHNVDFKIIMYGEFQKKHTFPSYSNSNFN
jgi:hypothetical protein